MSDIKDKSKLEDKYDFAKVEDGKSIWWTKNGNFRKLQSEKHYSIVLPPPNVTGKLHLGHAWDGAIQDFLIRFKTVQGYNALWLPGMDHAGIATQALIEKKILAEENKTRFDLGREKFLERIWSWKGDFANQIRKQWENMGLVLNYKFEKFTLDPEVNKIVSNIFVKAYDKKLIYRDLALVNWDTKLKTAISNIEVEHVEKDGKFYYFKYFKKDSNTEFIQIATTRPETMFGDQAIIVNPKDERYVKYHGQLFINPSNNEAIPVIADPYVDIEFGTGAMKCTPAHDFNDYQLGKKHNLARVNVMNPDGSMNELALEMNGLDRFVAREKLVAKLEASGQLIKVESKVINLSISQRSGTIIEPLMSKQWFMNMDELSKLALSNQAEGNKNKVNFYPSRFEDVYKQWLEKIEPWTISRQLWWGHRIPAWYDKTGNVKVSIDSPGNDWVQDEDVLDTWFSSALWPFVLTEFAKKDITDTFKKFYPTSVLVTGYDIIFFWVARMIFFSLTETSIKPFNDVFIHGLIRDEQNRKMSKSLGNGIDPSDLIKEYGNDAVRLSLLRNTVAGHDLIFSVSKVSDASLFINKLFNIAKFVELKFAQLPNYIFKKHASYKTKNESQISFHKLLVKTQKEIVALIDRYEFKLASELMNNFIWNEFANKYLEIAKIYFDLPNTKEEEFSFDLFYLDFVRVLLMAHPFIPFITDHIYQSIQKNIFINTSEQNKIDFDSKLWNDDNFNLRLYSLLSLKDEFNDCFEKVNPNVSIVFEARPALSEFRLKNGLSKKDKLYISFVEFAKLAINPETFLYALKLENIIILDFVEKAGKQIISNSLKEFVDFSKIEVVKKAKPSLVILEDGTKIDVYFEMTSEMANKNELAIANRIAFLNKEIERATNILSNEAFVKKAPKEKIDLERSKLANLEKELKELMANNGK